MKSGIHTHDIPMLVLRVAVGIIFIAHGWMKVANIGPTAEFMNQVFGGGGTFLAYLVGYVELIGGIMVLIGLWTSYASIALAGVIAVALFYVKGGAVFRAFNVPVFEIDLLLLASLVVLVLKGSGTFAVKPSGCPCCIGGKTESGRPSEPSVVYPNEGR